MAANAVGEGLWGFGASLAATLTVLPLLVERMGGGRTEVGLVGAVASVGFLLPQVAGSLALGRGTGRKRFLLIYHALLVIPLWAAMGLVPLLAGERPGAPGRALLFVAFGAYIVSVGFIEPLWLDFVAGLFRRETRGRAIGWSVSAWSLGSVPAAVLAGHVTRSLAYPLNYAALFLLGVAFYAASLIVFTFVRECDRPAEVRFPGRDVLARFGRSLVEPNFRRYLAARVVLTVGEGPVFLMAVHYKSPAGGGLSEGTVISLGAVIAASQATLGLVLGRLGDRNGHRIGALAGAAAQATAIAVALLVPGVASCAAAMALVGLMNAAYWVSHVNLLIETCPHDCRAAHLTVSNLVLVPVAALVPVATGWCVDVFGTGPTFAAGAAVTLLGLAWLLVAVKDPRTVPVRAYLEGSARDGPRSSR